MNPNSPPAPQATCTSGERRVQEEGPDHAPPDDVQVPEPVGVLADGPEHAQARRRPRQPAERRRAVERDRRADLGRLGQLDRRVEPPGPVRAAAPARTPTATPARAPPRPRPATAPAADRQRPGPARPAPSAGFSRPRNDPPSSALVSPSTTTTRQSPPTTTGAHQTRPPKASVVPASTATSAAVKSRSVPTARRCRRSMGTTPGPFAAVAIRSSDIAHRSSVINLAERSHLPRPPPPAHAPRDASRVASNPPGRRRRKADKGRSSTSSEGLRTGR